MKSEIKPLTHKDVALGIGRNFTAAELNEYLIRTRGGTAKAVQKIYKLKAFTKSKINISFLPQAEAALFEIASYIRHTNKPQSGEVFINDFLQRLSQFPIPGFNYMICTHPQLAALKLRCIAIDDWVIAFTQTDKEFCVHYIFYQPGLR